MANSNHTNNHTRHDYAALVPAVTSKKSHAQDEVLSMATRQRGLHKMQRRWEIKPVFDFLLGKETRLSIQTLMYDGHIKSSGILARHLEKAWVIQNQENGLRSFCAVPPPPIPPKGIMENKEVMWPSGHGIWLRTERLLVQFSLFSWVSEWWNQRLVLQMGWATKGGCATSMCMLTTPRQREDNVTMQNMSTDRAAIWFKLSPHLFPLPPPPSLPTPPYLHPKPNRPVTAPGFLMMLRLSCGDQQLRLGRTSKIWWTSTRPFCTHKHTHRT